MKKLNSLIRNAHFLGTKIRNLRKRNNLTMEDLSARCIKENPDASPSVSYLSMIERGKRVPSEDMLKVIAQVFQKDIQWFLDDAPDEEAIIPFKGKRGGIRGMALEPSLLFSNDILEIALPELVSQAGVSGQHFAHLLIRAYQEHHQNHFPDIERAAEEVGKKEMPLSLDKIMAICKNMGLEIIWFDRLPAEISSNEENIQSNNLVRSFFVKPNKVYLNTQLKSQEMRLKYDLAMQIGHLVLHNGDGIKSMSIAGLRSNEQYIKKRSSDDYSHRSTIQTQDIINTWRDFECSFFAAALLCPKVPFRQLLDRHNYEINVGHLLGVSTAVIMRRMTAVSPYPYWHYLDAYPPGKLKAIYRGNGIPLPWGNMRMVLDPCQHWGVFRLFDSPKNHTSSQISVLEANDQSRLYACESTKVYDLAKNPHVICTGIDLNPALESQGKDAQSLAEELKEYCSKNGGAVSIPDKLKKELMSIAKILNIAWIERGLENPARLICPRSSDCPRNPCCYNQQKNNAQTIDLDAIQKDIINSVNTQD